MKQCTKFGNVGRGYSKEEPKTQERREREKRRGRQNIYMTVKLQKDSFNKLFVFNNN